MSVVRHLAKYATAADGTRVYFEAHGLGEGAGPTPPPAVLLVHGSGGHHAAWWQQVPALRGSYSVVTLDLRGFGRSGPATGDDGTVDARGFPEDILAVLRDPDLRATGIGPAVLVGQSIGAAAALRAALSLPAAERSRLVAGVVLAHSLGGIDDPELTARVRADRAKAERLPVLDRLLTPAFRAADPARTFLFRQLGTFNSATMADLRNLGAGGPTIRQLRESGLPLCLLAGELDAVLSADTIRAASALLPDAHVELVAGAPHSMYWESPEEFNAALRRFLDRVFSGRTVGAGA